MLLQQRQTSLMHRKLRTSLEVCFSRQHQRFEFSLCEIVKPVMVAQDTTSLALSYGNEIALKLQRYPVVPQHPMGSSMVESGRRAQNVFQKLITLLSSGEPAENLESVTRRAVKFKIAPVNAEEPSNSVGQSGVELGMYVMIQENNQLINQLLHKLADPRTTADTVTRMLPHARRLD